METPVEADSRRKRNALNMAEKRNMETPAEADSRRKENASNMA
jgi:hypothetical protein